jgi:2-polyprenyl-3-methyl-5-hydroxy-6-metoxy-1,4-benzoquinol methylase
MPAHTDSGYIMGTTAEEYERLRIQAKAYEQSATAVLDRLHLGPGMSCLDVGCGPGEVMRLMAERVGPAGRVVGTDVDERLGQQALRDLHALGHAQCSFVAADLYALEHSVRELFDLVYARLLVQHLDDPLAGLGQMYQQVKPGGYLVVQDMYLMGVDSDSPSGMLRELRAVVAGVWGGGPGARDGRAGMNMPGHFIRAGIGAPDGTDVRGNLTPMRQAAGMMMSVYRSVLPVALKLGVTTEERSHQFFAEGAQAALDDSSYVLMPLMISTWKKKPDPVG